MDRALARCEAIQAPHSLGTAVPAIPVPLGATDCHHHIFDPRFEPAPGRRAVTATADDYRLFKRRLGLARSVVVAPSTYGEDNACLLDALQALGITQARGVAMVPLATSEAEMDRLHAAGVRGIRVYMGQGRMPDAESLQTLAVRAQRRGWHMQFVGDRHTEELVRHEPLLTNLACAVVIDHLGYAPQPHGATSATAAALRRMLVGGSGQVYVKLSGTYIQSKMGPPEFADADELASELIQLAPERMLWGSDWPHTALTTVKPDGALLLARLASWTNDSNIWRQILVDNPDRLYWRT